MRISPQELGLILFGNYFMSQKGHQPCPTHVTVWGYVLSVSNGLLLRFEDGLARLRPTCRNRLDSASLGHSPAPSGPGPPPHCLRVLESTQLHTQACPCH